jgi:hypothetical protein
VNVCPLAASKKLNCQIERRRMEDKVVPDRVRGRPLRLEWMVVCP